MLSGNAVTRQLILCGIPDANGEMCAESAKRLFRQARRTDRTATQKDIDRVTEKLGDRVAKVYGWELPEKVYRFAPEKEKIRDEGR